MKNKFWMHLMITFTLIFGLFLATSLSLKAATPVVVDIPTGEESGSGLSKYDIDGDGKADTLKVYDYYDEENYGDYYGRVDLNGKKIKEFGIDEEFSGYRAKLIILKNGKKFLFLDCNHSEYTSQNIIYQYSKGYFEEDVDINDIFGGTKYGNVFTVTSMKASGNTLTINVKYNSRTFGLSIVKYKFVYKNGKLKKSPTYGWITKITQKKSGKKYNSKILVTKKALKAYKSATSNKKYKTIKKGKKVKADRIYYSSRYGMRIRVKYGKKYMWVKCSGKTSNGYFKYIYYEE